MSNDYRTTEVQATQYPTDWEPNPVYFGEAGVCEYAATGGRRQSPLPGSPRTSRGCADGSTAVHSDQGTIRSRIELVLARLLEGKRERTDSRHTAELCKDLAAWILSTRPVEHLPLAGSFLHDLRERTRRLDLINLSEPQTRWSYKPITLTNDRATTGFRYTGTYNTRSGGGDT
jgi:hypothetical protein